MVVKTNRNGNALEYKIDALNVKSNIMGIDLDGEKLAIRSAIIAIEYAHDDKKTLSVDNRKLETIQKLLDEKKTLQIVELKMVTDYLLSIGEYDLIESLTGEYVRKDGSIINNYERSLIYGVRLVGLAFNRQTASIDENDETKKMTLFHAYKSVLFGIKMYRLQAKGKSFLEAIEYFEAPTVTKYNRNSTAKMADFSKLSYKHSNGQDVKSEDLTIIESLCREFISDIRSALSDNLNDKVLKLVCKLRGFDTEVERVKFIEVKKCYQFVYRLFNMVRFNGSKMVELNIGLHDFLYILRTYY